MFYDSYRYKRKIQENQPIPVQTTLFLDKKFQDRTIFIRNIDSGISDESQTS